MVVVPNWCDLIDDRSNSMYDILVTCFYFGLWIIGYVNF